MPKPKQGESENDFIDRCIPIVLSEGTTDDSSQAAAICHSIWDNKKSASLKTKGIILSNIELKDLSEEKGKVAFYYSAFGNTDLGGDIVQDTAFVKTVKENFKHIYHNRDHYEAVGVPLEFGQDAKGAYVVSQLGIKTACGMDCFEQYKAGMIKGHSMEYEAIKWSYDETTDTRTITEAKLWGVTSITNIPMNLDTPTISIKSLKDIDIAIKEIETFLTKGNISDECGKLFLKKYDRLKLLAKSLEDQIAAGESTEIGNEPSKTSKINFTYLTNNLKF